MESEEEKYTIAVINSEVENSVFNIIEHNDMFTIYTPGYWQDPDTIKKLEELIEQTKSNQIQLLLEEVNKRGLEIKLGLNSFQ